MCFLFFIGRKISYYDLGERFGVSSSTAYKWCTYMCNLILLFKSKYISLPSSNEFGDLSRRFCNYSNFPGTVLVIDGTHVPISCPSENHGRYINRKGGYSLNFLVAVDPDFKIRYVFGGAFGSSHDSFIFQASSLENWAESTLVPPESYHILGDSAYPERTYLKRPYKGILTLEKRRFNSLIIPQRAVVERSFGYFKTKFQKFRHENVQGEKQNTTVTSG